MKLLALPTSPFAARVLIQAYEKGLDLDVEYPPDGIGPKQHAAGNPFEKTPILLHGQDRIIESAVIQEYLEDICPSPSLRGADPMSAARIRVFVRAVDLYFFPALFALRGIGNDAEKLQDSIQSIRTTIDRLQELHEGAGYLCGDSISLADCTLVPACFYLERFLARENEASIFVGRPTLKTWWKTVMKHDAVSNVISQLNSALQSSV